MGVFIRESYEKRAKEHFGFNALYTLGIIVAQIFGATVFILIVALCEEDG